MKNGIYGFEILDGVFVIISVISVGLIWGVIHFKSSKSTKIRKRDIGENVKVGSKIGKDQY